MLDSIFLSATSTLCDAKNWAPYVCALGASRSNYWVPEEAYKSEGVPPTHELFKHTDWWATGTLIHPRAVLSVAHALRSNSIMGDRVLLPSIQGGACHQRILRVKRMIDHPYATLYKGYDLRLYVLHYDEAQDSEGAKLVLKEAGERQAILADYTTDDPTDQRAEQQANKSYMLHGFSESLWSPPHPPLEYTLLHRQAKAPKDAADVQAHGHEPVREFVIRPCPCLGRKGTDTPTAVFGDSGSPVASGKAEDVETRRVVGMYARRSLNRAAAENPDLVAIKVGKELRHWIAETLARHGILDFPEVPAETPPAALAVAP